MLFFQDMFIIKYTRGYMMHQSFYGHTLGGMTMLFFFFFNPYSYITWNLLRQIWGVCGLRIYSEDSLKYETIVKSSCYLFNKNL